MYDRRSHGPPRIRRGPAGRSMGGGALSPQWLRADPAAPAGAIAAANDSVPARQHHVQPGRWRMGMGPIEEAALRAQGDTALALHDLRQTGFSPAGHGSAANPMIVDGRGKSVRIAWSNSGEDRKVVDDLIAYLLSL